MNTYERIESILIDRLFVRRELVMPSATMVGLKLDSFDQVEFACEVEREFAVDVDHESFALVRTIGELVFALEKHAALQARAA